MEILKAGISLGAMGLIFGLILAYASKVFAVEVDERVPQIIDVLPSANCGGCGFAGCAAYAKAVVEGSAKTNCCPVGGDSVASKVAEIMGVAAEKTVRVAAHVMCCGTQDITAKKCDYVGINDCLSAMRFAGGDKTCSYGCMGFGTCVNACKFGAISIVNGIAHVDRDKCTACGMCAAACPRKLISILPYDSVTFVECMNKDKGPIAKTLCEKACIACKICEKNCPEGAITVTDFVATIDKTKCINCGICADKCPRKCIAKVEQ